MWKNIVLVERETNQALLNYTAKVKL